MVEGILRLARPTLGALGALGVLGALFLALIPALAAAEELEYRLENGLRVTLIPAGEAAQSIPQARIAVLVLYDLGEVHDPEGRAGLAHLIEHLWVTAAAGGTPARTAEEWFAAHEGQANAQTGRDYTVFAAVARPDRLASELADVAARVAGIRLEPSDLARELPRLRAELDNMYGGISGLAARNHAQNAVDPLPGSARKGGDAAQLEGIPLAEIAERISRHYTPSRARLIVAGAFPEQAARESIESLFGPIPAREAAPLAPREAPAARLGERIDLPAATAERIVARLWRAPDLVGADAAAYLLLGAKFLQVAPAHGVIPVFTPIDDPRVFGGIVTLAAGESAEAGLARIGRAFDTALKVEGPEPNRWAERSLDSLLTLRPAQPAIVAMNPYLVALGAGRRAQLGLDRAALVEGIAAAGDGLAALRESLLAPDRSVTVSIAPAAPKE